MNAEPLVELLKRWGKHASDGVEGIKIHAARTTRHLKTKIKIGIEGLSTKIFKNYGIGVPDKEYRKSILSVTKTIYNELFGKIDMTLFANDCHASHQDSQYNTRTNAANSRIECVNTCVENVAEIYKEQIDYVFKMQQLSIHPVSLPDELIVPTDYDRMIFIIDLMCSPDPISYELGHTGQSGNDFLIGYKIAKCGNQIQSVATVSYNRRGNPSIPKNSALKVVGRPIQINTMEDVIKYSPTLSANWRRETKKHFKRRPFQTMSEIPKELITDINNGYKMPRYTKSQLSSSTKKAIRKASKHAKNLSRSAKTLHAFGFTRSKNSSI